MRKNKNRPASETLMQGGIVIPHNEKRNKTIMVRLTEREFSAIKRISSNKGILPSDFARDVLNAIIEDYKSDKEQVHVQAFSNRKSVPSVKGLSQSKNVNSVPSVKR